MRLHTLELQAFGPFATPQVIDFDRLAAGGLFLLEGPTGAGKTTVLDAISFALYGGLASEDAGADRTHSHFADPGAEPSVRLEFSVRGVRYLISRVPEHRRPKRRGHGYTSEPARVHLRRREAGQWVSMSSNKAEVGDAIMTRGGRCSPGCSAPSSTTRSRSSSTGGGRLRSRNARRLKLRSGRRS